MAPELRPKEARNNKRGLDAIDYETLMNRNSTEIDADPLGTGGI